MILFFSDLHLDDRPMLSKIDSNSLNSRLNEGLNILDQILQLAKSKGIRHVVHLGDLTEKKDRIPSHIINSFSGKIQDFSNSKVDFFSLLGNHDFSLRSHPNFKFLSYSYMGPHFYLIDDRTVFSLDNNRIGMIPFRRDWKEFLLDLDWVNGQDPDIVCFHQTLEGSSFSSGKKAEGFSWIRYFKKNIVYLSGDVHCPQNLYDRVQYLGSPYPTSFGEDGDRFVWLWDKKKLSSIRLKYPDFVTVELGSFPEKEKIAENYVRVVGKGTLSQEVRENCRKILMSYGAKGISFLSIPTEKQKEKKRIESVTDEEIIREFVLKEDPPNRQKILNVGLKLIGVQ